MKFKILIENKNNLDTITWTIKEESESRDINNNINTYTIYDLMTIVIIIIKLIKKNSIDKRLEEDIRR